MTSPVRRYILNTKSVPVVVPTACVVPFLLSAAATLCRHSAWHTRLQYLDLVTAHLLDVSSAVCTRQPLTASTLACFTCQLYPSSARARGCSTYGAVLFLPRPTCLRLIMFCTCPYMCVGGTLWPKPARVWCDIRYVVLSSVAL